MTDRLHWWEDIPLGLALVAQSYVVGLWYYGSIHGASWQVDMAVAIGAGLALDLIVVTTVMGRRMGRSSGWSWATSFGAFLCSSLIALDRYGWEARSMLHVAFPLVVFLYSQHLATPRKRLIEADPGDLMLQVTVPVALPERLEATEETKPTSDTALDREAFLRLLIDDRSVPITVEEALALGVSVPSNGAQAARYRCPHCQAPLASKQALGASVKNGHCPNCKQVLK